MADNLPFLTLSSRRPADGNSTSSSRDSAYGSSLGDDRTPSATHDISRVNYHVKHLPDFARTLEESAARAFPNHGSSQRYKKVRALLLHWKSDDLFVLPELEDLDTCLREDYNFETETFSMPSDNAHLELMLKIGAMIKDHESKDTLFIIYYGGHARIDNARQSTWCANRSSDSPWLQWSAIQTLLERSLSDVLILLDCCAGAASATFPNGNSITETISASSWDAIAPDPGRYSFTSTLIEVLQEWNKRIFSAAMLHAEVLARLKHPRPEMRNGQHFEARSTPVHFMMTANHRAPSIEMSRILPPEARPPSPPQELAFDEGAGPAEGRSAAPQEIIGSEPSVDVPHVMISLALEDDQRLNISDWEQWLQSIPAIAKYVKVQGVFKSHSTLLLLSMPVMVWDLLPENHACSFVAFVRSNNLMLKDHDEPISVDEEIQVGADTDAESRFSIFSGTTAYTFNDRRPSLRSSIGLGARTMHGQSHRVSSIYSREPHTPDYNSRGWTNHNLAALARQQTAPATATLNRSISHDNILRTPIMNQQRDARRAYLTSRDNLPNRPKLAVHVESRLEEYFTDNPSPTIAVKEFLASNLGIETADIDLWFFHRREQQEVSDRLQSLRIDDQGHGRPREAPWMILPGHLNKLLEVVPQNEVLMIDLRSPADFERSHIHGAINFRAPASFVSRATIDLIEKALPSEEARSTFTEWRECKCVVFYDRHVEFAWEAPTAEALYQKLRSKGWGGQCFVLKGHYREFSASFDKYIEGTRMTDDARDYILNLQETTDEKTVRDYRERLLAGLADLEQKLDPQQYDEWFKQLEDEDTHHTDLVPAVKAERMEEMVQHQRKLEDEFERQQPSLHRKIMDLEPGHHDERWDVMGPMVAPFARSIAKMQHHDPTGTRTGTELGLANETGKTPLVSGGSGGGSYQSYNKSYHDSDDKSKSVSAIATPPGIDEYDLLESDEEQFASERERASAAQKSMSAATPSSGSRERAPSSSVGADDVDTQKKQARLYGGRGFLNKIIRSSRSDGPR